MNDSVIGGVNKEVFNVIFGPYIEPRLPVQSPVCKIIDYKPERRNSFVFRAVQLDGKLVSASDLQFFRKFCPESGISASVAAELFPV